MHRKTGMIATVLSFLFSAILRLIIVIFRLTYYSLVMLLTFFNGLYFIVKDKGTGLEAVNWIAAYYVPFELKLIGIFGEKI